MNVMNEWKAPWRQGLAAAVGLALGLSACSDLGTVSTSEPVGTPALFGSNTNIQQPPTNAQLLLTNTYAAHALGYTGAGVTIAVIDSGIMARNPAVAGRVQEELIYVDPTQNNTAIDDVAGHGTWVSQIAAGSSYAQFAGGIAPGANLVSARIIPDNAPDDNGSTEPTMVTPSDATPLGQINRDMISAGALIENNSWGGISWDTTDQATTQAFDAAYSSFVKSHNGLVVFQAGNDSRANPSTIAALPYYARDSSLQQGWLTVVSLNSNYPTQLDSYSNKCGVAMNFCLAAPGDVIVLDKDTLRTTTNPTYYIVEGTSFSAAEVSGAAALVWQAYPYFSNQLVAQTILGTATPLGGSQPNPTFGYGALNVGAAVNGPAQFNWGNVTVGFSGSSSWNNAISGKYGLTMAGPGTLNLTRPSSYAGDTNVQGGTLNVVSLGGNANISQGATLGPAAPKSGISSIAGNLVNNGTFVASGGNTKIGGSYTQGTAGSLSVTLGSALDVAGAATLNGGDLYVFGANQGYVVSSHTLVLTADGGLTGTFKNLDFAPSVVVAASVQYDAKNAWLDVTQANLTQIQGLPYTAASYQAAVRTQGALEQIDNQLGGALTGQPIAASFINGAASLQRLQTPAAAQQSLESLSGQLHAASAAMAFQAIDADAQALSNHFDRLLDAAPDTSRAGIWSQSLDSYGDLWHSGYSNVGFDLDGLLMGEDHRIGQDGVAGFAIAQSESLERLAGSADQSDSRAAEGMFYGGLTHDPWYATGEVGAGRYDENMHRVLQLGELTANVSSLSDTYYSLARGESGYRFDLAGLRLTPYAELQYTRTSGDSFDEPGGYGFGLKAVGHTVERWQTGAGLRADRRWSFIEGGSLSSRTRLLWQRAFALRGVAFDASFTSLQQWVPLSGIYPSRYGAEFGETLDWRFGRRSRLSFDYQQTFAQYDRSRMVSLNYRWMF